MAWLRDDGALTAIVQGHAVDLHDTGARSVRISPVCSHTAALLALPALSEAETPAACSSISAAPQASSAASSVDLREWLGKEGTITAATWSPAAAGSPLLAVGASSGLILIVDARRGCVVARCGSATEATMPAVVTAGSAAGSAAAVGSTASTTASSLYSSPVAGLAWLPDGRRLVSGADGSQLVVAWDTEKLFEAASTGTAPAICAAVATYSTGDPTGTSALLALDASRLLVGASSVVHLLDASAAGAGARKATLVGGHRGPVTALAATVASSTPDHTAVVVSASAGETHVCVWHVPPLAQAGAGSAPTSPASAVRAISPSALLTHPTSVPRRSAGTAACASLVSVLQSPQGDNTYHVACVGSDGAAMVWRQRTASGSRDCAGTDCISHSTIIAPSGSSGSRAGAASRGSDDLPADAVLAVRLQSTAAAAHTAADAGTACEVVLAVGAADSPRIAIIQWPSPFTSGQRTPSPWTRGGRRGMCCVTTPRYSSKQRPQNPTPHLLTSSMSWRWHSPPG